MGVSEIVKRSRWWRLASALAGVAALSGCFSMGPVPPPPGLRPVEESQRRVTAIFDGAASPVVDSAWGGEGTFVLVRPLVEGRDVGWFILDTGASGCTISAAAARRAGLEAVGTARLQGHTETTVFRCRSFQVGPLRLEGLLLSGLDMGSSGMAFGHDVAGIVGREVCANAVVEMDGPRRTVRLLDPASFHLAGDVLWHAVQMQRGLPLVRCTYAEGVRGLFVVDTGANTGVMFTGAAVERSDLTAHPSVQMGRTRTQVTFGARERIGTGTLHQFAVGDQEVAPVPASFGSPGDAPSSVLGEADGVIGMGLLRRFVVYLDERQERLALVDSGG